LNLLGCIGNDSQQPSDNENVISLSPAITETIYALGAEQRLTGRSDYCIAPPQAGKIATFGTALTPNFEAIARIKPSHILLDNSLGAPAESLNSLAPVVQLPWLTVFDVSQSIRQLGLLFKKEEKANLLADQIVLALKPTHTEQSPTMLALMSGSDIAKGQVWYMRSDSLHGAALKRLGFAMRPQEISPVRPVCPWNNCWPLTPI
jgi:ABC-type Fe3+-hydroxamate transport system substrate-binding protein